MEGIGLVTVDSSCSSPDTVRATPSRASPRWRLAGVLLLASFTIGLLVWMEVSTWRQVRQLEDTFTEARPLSFLHGIRLREGMEQLTALLLLFELSSDAEARARFQTVAAELRDRLSQPESVLFTAEEREIWRTTGPRLDRFLLTAEPMLEAGVRGIRKDTAEQLHAQIQVAAAPVFAVADRLVSAQERASRSFFADSRASLTTLRRWLVVSLLLLVLLMTAVAAMIYRALVTPLRTRLSATEAVIARQERLVSLGTLVAGVAHEIRNPLTAIKFRLFSLRKSLPVEGVDQEDLTVIQDEVHRLEHIVKEFLQFARPAEPVLDRFAAVDLLAAVNALLRNELEGRGLRLEVVAGERLHLRADRQQLQQVLINLLLNAADATEAGGTVTLRVLADEASLNGRSRAAVVLEVSDTGRGIPAGLEQQIFDPFFSTKESGTGLGLPIAARIVEKHGGYLQVSAHSPRGTTFRAVLPRASDDESQTVTDRG